MLLYVFSINEIRFLTKKHQTAVHEGIVELSQKKQNLILTSLQIRKNINVHYFSLQYDLATLYWSDVFPLEQSVKC